MLSKSCARLASPTPRVPTMEWSGTNDVSVTVSYCGTFTRDASYDQLEKTDLPSLNAGADRQQLSKIGVY